MQTIDAQKLGKFMILNEDGLDLPLSDLWNDQTAVLFFVRHFG